jgi:hypothetical protein
MSDSVRTSVHLLLHVLLPGAAARVLFPSMWRRAWLVMVATMLVDLDHLLASPILDVERCSIGFHPLHTAPAIAVYGLMLLFKPSRLIGLGLALHMAIDGLDCVWMRW